MINVHARAHCCWTISAKQLFLSAFLQKSILSSHTAPAMAAMICGEGGGDDCTSGGGREAGAIIGGGGDNGGDSFTVPVGLSQHNVPYLSLMGAHEGPEGGIPSESRARRITSCSLLLHGDDDDLLTQTWSVSARQLPPRSCWASSTVHSLAPTVLHRARAVS